MRAAAHLLSAQVDLPCRVFCGPNAYPEFFGTAVRIDTSSMILRLDRGARRTGPEIGEQIRLELLLPVTSAPKAKCLSVQGSVVDVAEGADGVNQVALTFRKARFQDRSDAVSKPPKSAASGWEM